MAAANGGSGVHYLLTRRTRAYLRDCIGYLGVAASTVPISVVLNRLGLGGDRWVVLVVSALPPVAATVIAGLQEAGPHQSTLGKRRERLAVADAAGNPLTLSRALIRNAVKIGIPWQLGHVVAIGASFGGFKQRDPLTLVATAVTDPLLAAMVIAVARGSGRALHDRAAGTQVLSTVYSS
jgi:uncharacterized RDD family membrane protein YckC